MQKIVSGSTPARLALTFAAAVLLLLTLPRAMATNDMRPLGVLVMSQMCAAQSPRYREGLFGRLMGDRLGSWKAFDDRPLSRCFRERQWLPDSLCASVTALDPSDPKELDAWWNSHAETLRTLDPVFDFFNDVEGQRTPETECPSIALEAPKKESSPPPSDIAIERVDLIWAGEYRGTVNVVPDVTLVQSTDRIAAAPGVHFGLYFNIVSKPADGILTMLYKITVPEPGLPTGYTPERERMSTDRSQCLIARPCLVGFVFEREEEIIPGKWTLEVSFRGKTLIQHDFTVYRKE